MLSLPPHYSFNPISLRFFKVTLLLLSILCTYYFLLLSKYTFLIIAHTRLFLNTQLVNFYLSLFSFFLFNKYAFASYVFCCFFFYRHIFPLLFIHYFPFYSFYSIFCLLSPRPLSMHFILFSFWIFVSFLIHLSFLHFFIVTCLKTVFLSLFFRESIKKRSNPFLRL
ncbi:unnamed protein product [Acanthosepion pharaonis]|uniref:Uncharacterized protein n=1 Tax=Acanthosepion pharaonis TaxID=158019 RepID=A0A812DS39_ACAPH|nr:unnamed protein product [Sepia pharaonis]